MTSLVRVDKVDINISLNDLSIIGELMATLNEATARLEALAVRGDALELRLIDLFTQTEEAPPALEAVIAQLEQNMTDAEALATAAAGG